MNGPAQSNISIVEEMQSKILSLENENRLLKESLDEAGISYVDIVPNNSDDSIDFYDAQKKDGVRCKDCELRAYKPVTL